MQRIISAKTRFWVRVSGLDIDIGISDNIPINNATDRNILELNMKRYL